MLNNEIKISDKELFDPYMYSYPYNLSETNFTNLFMWKHLNDLRYDIIHDLLCISGKYYGKPFVFPPLTRESYDIKKLSKTIDILNAIFIKNDHPFLMKILPHHMVPIFQEAKSNLSFERDRSNDDYVYLSEDLIHLKGRKYHGKKNHFNYFLKNFSYQYVPLTYDLVEECLSLVHKIKPGNYTDTQSFLLDSEEIAIENALENMDVLGFKGGAILIDGHVEAFTFGEKINEDTMLIHIEKANTEYRGLYQVINQKFCENECSDVKYINREEDMGFEYLRKAKQSYHPIKMIEKYNMTIL